MNNAATTETNNTGEGNMTADQVAEGTVVKVGKNKAGRKFAIVKAAVGFIVYSQSHNYRQGRIVATWGYVAPKNMPFTEKQYYSTNGGDWDSTLAIFTKKINGKERP